MRTDSARFGWPEVRSWGYGCPRYDEKAGFQMVAHKSLVSGIHTDTGRWLTLLAALAALVSSIVFIAAATQVHAAADIVVTTTADVVDGSDGVLSLREAVTQANDQAGDDTIVLSAGTYALTIGQGKLNAEGDLDHEDTGTTLTIKGAGSGSTSIIAPVIGDRVIEVHGDADLALQDIKIAGGAETGGAGIQLRGGDLTTTRVVIDGNDASDRGGGVFLDVPGSFNGTDTVFSNNAATVSGGGLNVAGGSVVGVNVSFIDNTATTDFGAGVRGSGGPFSLTGGTWTGNTSQRSGGVASFVGSPTVTIVDVTASNNESVAEDGGALSTDGGSLSVTGSDFSNNTAKTNGGAISVNAGMVSIDSTVFDTNTATDSSGGALWLNDATDLDVATSSFVSNSAGDSGGAIRQLGDTAEVVSSLFNANTAVEFGGAVSTATDASLDLINSTLVFNTAGTSGGAIKSGAVELTFVTITSNTAGSFGSNIRAESLTSTSSVSAYGNTVEECKLTVPATAVSSFGHDSSCFGVALGNPQLLGLADNGGPTETRLPSLDSPLVGAAAVVGGVTTDQRGVGRPQGATPDIGAAELQAASAVGDSKTIDEGQSVTVSVLANDSDPDGVIDSASVETTSGPAHGSTTDNGDGTITYTPNAGYNGSDSFNYGFNAGTPLPGGAKVTITVNSVGSQFLDIGDSVFQVQIEWLADEGITKGCNPPDNTLFCPTATVTRGQMAAFLNRALDLPSTTTDFFTDDEGSVFEDDINRLAAAGITKGCNPPANDLYCVDNKVTRGQMAAFLVRAYGFTEGAGDDLFIDDDGLVFENDIDRLGTSGVTKGCNPPTNDRYCPDSNVTREQMAAFLYRAEH